MNHITFIIAKQLLQDKKKELAQGFKGKGETKAATKQIEEIKRGIKAIEEELWLLNNW